MLFPLVYFLSVIVPAIIVVVGAIVIDQVIESRISSYGEEKKLPQSHIHAIKLISRWIIAISGILLVAAIFGISIGRLWLVISTVAAMIIVGFIAVWSLLSNILAALVLMIWRPFQIGDKVSLLPENITGTVKETNLFFTRIETEDGSMLNITNSNLIGKMIKVYSDDLEKESKV
ncbi:hypothetical protein AKJ56_00265 [candidate division MSBL1 archaeon SCGC-AAA382N08]|uniref:Mechanosensitive ion channel MscS domain-containing protein n=1 Tax=candidate division MSBL1 archaeon SCGC-AAA382N08 TaxID=1698285 RepID=A0A133VQR9_9EURY|nr:hypothetical protein AKJ56_00265 [candidate division MSBL1 archaeon SCGC-AAA382N08]